MIKAKITLISALVSLMSCAENSGKDGKEVIAEPGGQEQIDSTPIKVEDRINFANLEQYYTADSVFSFVAPVGFFVVSERGLLAKDGDFGMTTKTYAQLYPCDPEEQILTLKSIQAEYMRDIKVTYKSLKQDFFVVSGLDAQDRIVYVKGDYEEMRSMQGRDEGEPAHIWSKAGVIRFSYPQEKKADFNRVVEIISNSLRVNHDLF
jgi:hypothetical protein